MRIHYRLRRSVADAFTLIELLVVMSIIGVLLALLLPALGSARRSARTTACLSNVRNMQLAHWMYLTDHDGAFIDVGLGHGASHGDESAAWINTLSGYYGSPLLARSPLDDSPHWGPAPGGSPIPGAPADQRRRTSYGVNNYLTPLSPTLPYLTIDSIPQPAAVNQFLIMAYRGSFAGADHPHVETWYSPFLPGVTPQLADDQVQIDAAGGESASFAARSNWGFLDGHAATLTFDKVYRNPTQNRMNPAVAR